MTTFELCNSRHNSRAREPSVLFSRHPPMCHVTLLCDNVVECEAHFVLECSLHDFNRDRCPSMLSNFNTRARLSLSSSWTSC